MAVAPHDVSSAPVVVRMLGPFRLAKSGRDVTLRPGSKTESLIVELALLESGASRDELTNSIWPGSHPDLAAHSLRSLVHALHEQFADVLGGAAPVVRADGRYRLNWTAGVATDVAVFESAIDEGDRARRRGDEAAAMGAYENAIELYGGDLCIGSDVRHLLQRERLRVRYLTLRAWLGESAFRTGDYRTALAHAEALLQSDPCREDAYRLSMRCHVRLGQRAQALRVYHICRSILESEFDALPEPETLLLYESIRVDPGAV